MKNMKLAIVGSRNPGISYKEWESLLLSHINVGNIDLVVSGGAKGIDAYAKAFAGRHSIPLIEYLPDYAKFGKYATLRRNSQIVREASCVVAFPSAESRGTLHTIREAEGIGKRVTAIRI